MTCKIFRRKSSMNLNLQKKNFHTVLKSHAIGDEKQKSFILDKTVLRNAHVHVELPFWYEYASYIAILMLVMHF